MGLKSYVGKYGILNDEFKKNTTNIGNKYHKYSDSLVQVMDAKEGYAFPLSVLVGGETFKIETNEINLLEDTDLLIKLKVGERYDHYFGTSIIQMIDYKNRKMQLKYDDNSSEVIDIPKVKQTPIREIPVIVENTIALSPLALSKESMVLYADESFSIKVSDSVKNTDHSLHKALIEDMHETYLIKNKDYGNSFAEQFNEYGILSSVIRMDDKMRRLKQLMSNPANVKDESMIDTVQDLANYAVMTWMELVKEAEQNVN